MIKRMSCILLSFILLILSSISVLAGEPIKTEKHMRFVTGVIFIWCSKGIAWEPAAPMDLYTKNTSAKLGKGAKNVKIYPYDRRSFDPAIATEGAREKTVYDMVYMPYAGSELNLKLKTKPDENGEITYSYQFRLHSKMLYDVAAKLKVGEEKKVRDLLGYVSPEMEKFFSYARNNTLADDTNGQLYFAPYIIEWESPIVVPPFEEPEQATPPADTKGCSDVIQWSEVKTHIYHCGGCLIGGGCPGHTCRHVYTYQTTLKANSGVSPDKLKSGYGFGVTVDNKISTKQISNKGACGKSLNKMNKQIPVPPQAVEVRTGWTVKNRLGTQFKTNQLEKSSSTATSSKFTCRKNRISEIKERKIYTNVDLKGTAKKPVTHPISIVISGGGVNGIPFCKTISKTITINGNMYEDDFTVDRNTRNR